MIVVYTTFERQDQAKEVAKILLDERLIACANMWPISSMYTYNGDLLNSTEVAVHLKTSTECQDLLYKRLAELHPYECPAIMTINVDNTNPAFNSWIQSQTEK